MESKNNMKNNKKYYIGEYEKDSPEHHGWFVGKFMNGARKTDEVEIKYHQGILLGHKTKVSNTYECDIVIDGEMGGHVDNKPVTISKGEYIVIPPGVPNNLAAHTTKNLKVFTIKAPSDPTAKKVIE